MAFTLAEVLITLGIIGVVAALTMPSLIAEHRQKVTVTRLKHAYSVLSQAYRLSVLEDERTPKYWGMGANNDENSHITLANHFKPHLKILSDCVGKSGDYTKKTCYNNASFASSSSHAVLTLNNGTVLIFRTWDSACASTYGTVKNVCGNIIVDINGNKKPNLGGEDIFQFYITDDKGIVPKGSQGDSLSFSRYCRKGQPTPNASFSQMTGCTAWVVYNENLDYLKCPDKLDWDKASSCKN